MREKKNQQDSKKFGGYHQIQKTYHIRPWQYVCTFYFGRIKFLSVNCRHYKYFFVFVGYGISFYQN